MAADLEFRIGAELSEIKGALASLQRDFQNVGRSAQQAGGNNAFKGIESSAKAAVGSVTRLIGAFAALAGAIKLIGAADELNSLNARLKIATKSTEEFERAQAALFDMAQRTRTGLGETISLYSQIANATKDAGVGQETLLQVVETINQAVQLSGASAQAAQAALVQLGQGLASGTLRGEELNSILEQTPALADAIAKGMGITRGELRKYGEEGKITAEQVITALQRQRAEIQSQFAQLPVTVGQSITMLKNAGLAIVGAFDTATGATSGLASVLKDLADYLSSDEFIGSVIEFASVWSQAFRQIVDDAKRAVDIMKDATQDIVGSGEDIVQIIGRAFKELPSNIRATIQVITVQAAAMFDYLVSYATFVKDNFKAIFTDDTQDAAYARFQARNAAIKQAAQDTVDDALNERQKALDDAAKARADAEARRKSARQATGATGLGNFKAAPGKDEVAKAAALAKAKLDAEEKLADDASKRKLSTLENEFEDSLIGAAAYYARRQELELAALDRSIAIERERAKAGGVDQVKALAEIEILERKKEDVKNKGARDATEFARNLDKQLEQLRIQDLENGGNTAEAARRKAEAQFKDLLAKLKAQGDTEGVKLIERLINTETARAQFDKLKKDFDRVIDDMRARQQSIANQTQTGALTPEVASQEQSAARQQAFTELEALNAKMQELAATTNDPTIVEGAARVSQALQQLAVDSATGVDAAIMQLRASLAQMQQDFAKTATGAAVDSLTNLFTDLADGSKSASESIANFARSFVASMAQIAARALATYLVLQLLESFFPGAGKLVAAGGAVAAGVKHSGGMVGSGPTRSVNPLLFAGAPRYHSGGMVGLKPDERPAILQTGEEVLSRNDPRNQKNGGESGGNGYRILNVLDPSLVSNFMESSAGERTIMNIIGRNPSQVRQLIGS